MFLGEKSPVFDLQIPFRGVQRLLLVVYKKRCPAQPTMLSPARSPLQPSTLHNVPRVSPRSATKVSRQPARRARSTWWVSSCFVAGPARARSAPPRPCRAADCPPRAGMTQARAMCAPATPAKLSGVPVVGASRPPLSLRRPTRGPRKADSARSKDRPDLKSLRRRARINPCRVRREGG